MNFGVVEVHYYSRYIKFVNMDTDLLFPLSSYRYELLNCNYTGFNYPRTFSGVIPLWF